jgi:dolichol kinase
MANTDMQSFLDGRDKAKAYFCNLFSKNIPINKPLSKEQLLSNLIQIKSQIKGCDGVYVLDESGIQITDTYTAKEKTKGIGSDRSAKAYYYRAIRDVKCNITDPYPSESGGVCVTASQAIFGKDGELQFVACLDMPLEEVVKISHLDRLELFFKYFFKSSYALFAFSLMAVALLLFVKGAESFFQNEITPDNFKIKYVFEATILLTLALAIFDLSKTLVEEEVLGWSKDSHISGPHKTMVKFLGSIIIALSIEALMLVFKFAISNPSELIYAMYIIAGVAMLLIGLAVYIKFTKSEVDK